MAAVLAKGKTVITNAAKEPEVVDLVMCLKEMGAKILGAGSDRIEIEGVDSLQPCDYSVMADRIEIGTYLTAVTMTKGNVVIKCSLPSVLETILEKLKLAGANIEINDEEINLEMDKTPNPVDITTCLLYTSPSPRDRQKSRMPSSA